MGGRAMRRYACDTCSFSYTSEQYPMTISSGLESHAKLTGHRVSLRCANPACSKEVPPGSLTVCSERCGLIAGRLRRGRGTPVKAVVGSGQWLFEERQRLGIDRGQLGRWLEVGWRMVYEAELHNWELPRTWATELEARGFACRPWPLPDQDQPAPPAAQKASGTEHREEVPEPVGSAAVPDPRATSTPPPKTEIPERTPALSDLLKPADRATPLLPALQVGITLGCDAMRFGTVQLEIPADYVLRGLRWLQRVPLP